MVITPFAVRKDTSKWTFVLLLMARSALLPYRKARDEMQELMKAQKNVEIFFAEEKTTKEKAQTR